MNPELPDTPATSLWRELMSELAAVLRQRQLQPPQAVVLLPYAQLIGPARSAWQQGRYHALAPRFETTLSWPHNLTGFVPAADDLSFQWARDLLVAARLLERAGVQDAALRTNLVPRLVQAAYQLAPGAQAARDRSAWAQSAQKALGTMGQTSFLSWELLISQVAIAWLAHSAYASDALFNPELTREINYLWVIEGLQADPLVQALKEQFASRTHSSSLVRTSPQGQIQLHACMDVQDEAERTAACVLAHLSAGRTPVALPAQDRLQMRRIRALLAGSGVVVHDETGWTLSTTRAAAQVMNLLRASVSAPSSDSVLDSLKDMPAWQTQLAALEAALRKSQSSDWNNALSMPSVAQHVPLEFENLRASFRQPRPLMQWLLDVRTALLISGQWALLQADEAGWQVLAALGWTVQGNDWVDMGFNPSMDLSGFMHWCQQVFEAAYFVPTSQPQAQVVILPVSQLLGRSFAAVVLSGCDAIYLPASQEPAGFWSAAQRASLGLPSRQDLTDAAAAAWQCALQTSYCDVLWRTSEQGRSVLPSHWVQLLQNTQVGTDARVQRQLLVQAVPAPQPQGVGLWPEHLSASAYDDLRVCPYRFFAQRLLGLNEMAELNEQTDKRQWGNWLHEVLKIFHAQRGARPRSAEEDALALDQAAEQVTRSKIKAHLQAQFLPFMAAWPKVRDGYLLWLVGHEAGGSRFAQAELKVQAKLAQLSLQGRLDRLDTQPSPEGPLPFVLDYKTEAPSTTSARLQEPLEDTQLAFYAALLPDETLRAAYVNVGENGKTQTYEQTEVLIVRDELRQAILSDWHRIEQGHPMPALGEGQACEVCKVRGLCRKDFWS